MEFPMHPERSQGGKSREVPPSAWHVMSLREILFREILFPLHKINRKQRLCHDCLDIRRVTRPNCHIVWCCALFFSKLWHKNHPWSRHWQLLNLAPKVLAKHLITVNCSSLFRNFKNITKFCTTRPLSLQTRNHTPQIVPLWGSSISETKKIEALGPELWSSGK